LPLICTLNLTLVTEHIRKTFGWDYSRLEEQVRSVPAGCDGLLLLPYLTGERTPDLPNGTGVFHGLTLGNFTAPHMARAAFEGVTLGLGYGLGRFRELGMNPSEIRLTGGGSNSRMWRQMCADVFGVPTVCLQSGEGAGLGGAIQAGWVFNNEQGSNVSLAEISARLVQVDESSRNQPDLRAKAVYSDALNKTFEIRKALTESKLI
jgi:xylulokinase